MDGRMEGWMDGWIKLKAGLRIAYSFLDVDGFLTVIKNHVPGWMDGWMDG